MTAGVDSVRARRVFPMLLAVTRSYDIVFARFVSCVRVAAAWVATGFVVVVALWLWQPTRSVPPDLRMLAALITSLAVLGVLVVVSVGVANAWHRVVLEHAPARLGFDVTGLGRYAARSVVLFVSFVALTIALSLVVSSVYISDETVGLVAIAFALAYVLAIVRVGLSLPAASVGNQRVGFLTSWRLTRGATWRLFAGALLMFAPPFVAYQLLLAFIADSGMSPGFPLAPVRAGALVAGWAVVVALGATYLSLAYRFFVEGRDGLDDGTLDTLKDQFS